MTDVLRDGELTVEGRITEASNATLYCLAVLKGADSDIDADAGGGTDDAAAASASAAGDPDPARASASARTSAFAPAGTSVACVYKPIAGENPLWDFPDGTLAARDRKSTRLNSSHLRTSRMPSSA